MIRLVVVCLVAALGWMIWWAMGQAAYEQGLAAWVDQRRDAGFGADYSDLSTTGFPNRFDTTIRDLSLSDSSTATNWSVPFVQLLSLSYKPHQVIAVIAPTHQIGLAGQSIDVSQSDARASLFLSPVPSLPLASSRFVADDVSLRSSFGWDLTVAEARFAASKEPVQTNTYRVGAELNGLRPPKAMLQLIDPSGIMPPLIDKFHADAWVGLTAPLDRHSLETGLPRVTTIDLSSLSAEWNDAAIRFHGALTVDDRGIPNGEITVEATQWRKIFDLARTSGLIDANAASNLKTALTLISKGQDRIEATLDVKRGLISLGPIPLGPAPRFSAY